MALGCHERLHITPSLDLIKLYSKQQTKIYQIKPPDLTTGMRIPVIVAFIFSIFGLILGMLALLAGSVLRSGGASPMEYARILKVSCFSIISLN